MKLRAIELEVLYKWLEQKWPYSGLYLYLFLLGIMPIKFSPRKSKGLTKERTNLK